MKMTIAVASFGMLIVSCVAAAESPRGPAIVLAQATPASIPMTHGEIRKVDKDAGKITIKHGPLTNLEMPAMTMVFRVKDPAMLDRVKEGDKVNFVASRENGAITIVDLQLEK